MCCTHALISSTAHQHQSLLFSLWPLTSVHLIKTDCLIWPAGGRCGYEAANRAPSPLLIHSSPLPLLFLLFGCLGCIMWPGSVAPLHFPLLTERKYCNRRGRRWALLRRWLKITGIFKAAEESQGRQRLDSLPPGRSSLLPLSLFLAFSLSASSSKTISLHTSWPPNHTSTTLSYACGSPLLNYMTWWMLEVGLFAPHLCPAIQRLVPVCPSKQPPLTQTSSICIASYSRPDNLSHLLAS